MDDKRVRVFTPVERFISTYNNQLTWLQIPVSFQLKPLPKFKALDVSAGTGLGFLRSGHTSFTTYSNRVGELAGGSLAVPLDIPANHYLRRDWVVIGSIGVTIRKKVGLELTYQHIKPIAYATFDPGDYAINPPVYITRAGQGWLFATTYWFN